MAMSDEFKIGYDIMWRLPLYAGIPKGHSVQIHQTVSATGRISYQWFHLVLIWKSTGIYIDGY